MTSKSSVSLEAYLIFTMLCEHMSMWAHLYSALWNTACVHVFITNVMLT